MDFCLTNLSPLAVSIVLSRICPLANLSPHEFVHVSNGRHICRDRKCIIFDILSNRIFHPLGIFAVSILAPKLSVLVTFLELVSTWWHECHCPVTLVLVSQLTCCGVAFPYILSKSETLLFSVKCGFLNNFLFLIIGKTFPDKWWIRGFLFKECPEYPYSKKYRGDYHQYNILFSFNHGK